MHKVGRKRRGENHKEVEERERRHISLVFVKIHVESSFQWCGTSIEFSSLHLCGILLTGFTLGSKAETEDGDNLKLTTILIKIFPTVASKCLEANRSALATRPSWGCVWKKSDVQKFRGMYALTFLGMLLRNAHSTKFHQPYAPINFAHKRF